MLEPRYRRARIVQHWPDGALRRRRASCWRCMRGARRDSIRAWAQAHPGAAAGAWSSTGTDLYRDIATDCRRSVRCGRRSGSWCCRNSAPRRCPRQCGAKARVIFQSTAARAPLPRARPACGARDGRPPAGRQGAADAVRGGAAAARAGRHPHRPHRRRPKTPHWAEQARATARSARATAGSGPLPHAQPAARSSAPMCWCTPARLEGGAHVIMEAVRSGTPVLASRIPGNVGMLGADYAGYFEHGDARRAGRPAAACRDGPGPYCDDPARAPLARLRAQCALRASLFAPEARARGIAPASPGTARPGMNAP